MSETSTPYDFSGGDDFPHAIYERVPAGSSNILDFGFGDGALLRALAENKGCSNLYGVEKDIELAERMRAGPYTIVQADWSRPEDPPPAEWGGGFEYVIACMALEHTADPWLVLGRLGSLLAPEGRLLVQMVNAQYWEYPYRILCGEFPATSDGRWNHTRLRWFTLQSFAETADLAGFMMVDWDLLLHEDVDFVDALAAERMEQITLPPPELGLSYPPIHVDLSSAGFDAKPMYPLLCAPAFLCELQLAGEATGDPAMQGDGRLEAHRLAFDNPFRIFESVPPALSERIWRRMQSG